MHQSPPSFRGDDEMDPRVRLREAVAAIKNEECQRVIRVIAVLRQKRPATVVLHGNQEKGRFGRVALEPARATCAQIAEPIEDHYSALRFHLNMLLVGNAH